MDRQSRKHYQAGSSQELRPYGEDEQHPRLSVASHPEPEQRSQHAPEIDSSNPYLTPEFANFANIRQLPEETQQQLLGKLRFDRSR